MMPDTQLPPSRTPIPSLPADEARPLWSVMIPTYNCAGYLAQTLTSVLEQDVGPEFMQIEVIDDHSTDDPAKIVAEIGKGRIAFYQQPVNVGHIHNFDTCLQRAKGRIVHLLHGDDFVYQGFYHKLGDAFVQQPGLGIAFCRQVFVNDEGRQQALSPQEAESSGILVNALARLAAEQRIMTPSIVAPRAVYERLGGFDHRLVCSEDWEMWVRIAAQYSVWYEVEPLAAYRMHDNSNTGRHVRSGEDMYYTNMAINIFAAYLPPALATSVTRQAKQTYALAALRMAEKLASNQDRRGAYSQLREAWRLSRSRSVILQTMRLLPKLASTASSPQRVGDGKVE